MNFLKTSLAIVSTVILASCAKQLPKPSKDVKSVLVIPAVVVNKTNMERKNDYIFNHIGEALQKATKVAKKKLREI